MDPASPAATPRERDPSSWWFLIHTKLYRYRALLRKYWWLVVFTTCLGLAVSAWMVAQQKVVYVSAGRMMVSGKINLPEGTVYAEEMNYFMTTQRELMQDEAVRQRAEDRVRTTSPTTPIGPVVLNVAPLPQTSIFILTATGAEPEYPQKFLDALMQEYITTRRELRTEKGETVGTAIADEIARVEAELKKNEEKLLAFQRENNIGFLEQEGNSAGAFLSKLNTQLAELKTEAQLLELFELDQDIARKQRTDSTDTNTTREGDLRKPVLQGPELGYLQARQQLELLRTERDDYAKDLKPKHPIMVELDRKITQQQQLIETFRRQSADDLQRRREAARLEIQNLEKTIKEWSAKALDLSQRLAEYNSIQSGIAQKRTQLESLNKSKGTVEITRNVDQDVVSIRQKASVSQPQKPGVVRTVALGVAFGLLAGLLILVLFDQLDDRVASFSEFQVHFAERVLAQIPNASRRKSADNIELLKLDDERHSFAEAFRSLRSSIFFLPVEGAPPKTLLITSATPNEGKSTVAMNCAVTIAHAGSRVLLIDGDLRRGEIHRVFGLKNERGFTDVLTGASTLDAAVQPTHVANLSLLPRGGAVPNPGELYLSTAADRFLKEVYPAYDYIVIDSSPVMAADDTTSLAPKTDATVFVFRFTSSSARVSRKAIQFLRERQANVIGIVCNDVSEAMQEYYYYRYPEYYGPSKKRAATA